MAIELETVWSGDRGVFIGSGLREMAGYAVRPGKPGYGVDAPANPSPLTSARQQIRDYIARVPGQMVGDVAKALPWLSYPTIAQAMVDMAKKGQLGTSHHRVSTGGRPGRHYYPGTKAVKTAQEAR